MMASFSFHSTRASLFLVSWMMVRLFFEALAFLIQRCFLGLLIATDGLSLGRELGTKDVRSNSGP